MADKKYSNAAAKELVKFSDATIERGYKISYELAEDNLPPNVAREVESRLRHATNQLKNKNRETINTETVALIDSSITALVDVANDKQSFDEASRKLIAQSKTAVKNVVIQNAKDIAAQEAKQIGKDVAKKVGLQIFKGGGGAVNPAVNALIVGDLVKESALKFLNGEIDEAQFIKEVTRRCTVLALQAFATTLPGGVFASVAINHACNALFSVMDAADNQAAADRRKIISKIKAEALDEMARQRGELKKCFADEKFRWDKNIQAGFELIAAGTYSNDVETIAQGLDKIMQNFGGQVAFANREDFRRDFKRRKIVVNL